MGGTKTREHENLYLFGGKVFEQIYRSVPENDSGKYVRIMA